MSTTRSMATPYARRPRSCSSTWRSTKKSRYAKVELSLMEKRRLERVKVVMEERQQKEASGAAVASEVERYLAQPLESDTEDFSLLTFWKEKGSAKIDPKTQGVVAVAEFPYLSRLAALYLSVEGTSCQSERNFSALAHMLSDLRSRLSPFTVSMCVLLRLNREHVKGVKDVLAVKARRAANAACVIQQVATAHAKR
ncbi:unnamed protein product [Phaeothamnion confervicola]